MQGLRGAGVEAQGMAGFRGLLYSGIQFGVAIHSMRLGGHRNGDAADPFLCFGIQHDEGRSTPLGFDIRWSGYLGTGV